MILLKMSSILAQTGLTSHVMHYVTHRAYSWDYIRQTDALDPMDFRLIYLEISSLAASAMAKLSHQYKGDWKDGL
jgi:hypothetical protein